MKEYVTNINKHRWGHIRILFANKTSREKGCLLLSIRSFVWTDMYIVGDFVGVENLPPLESTWDRSLYSWVLRNPQTPWRTSPWRVSLVAPPRTHQSSPCCQVPCTWARTALPPGNTFICYKKFRFKCC